MVLTRSQTSDSPRKLPAYKQTPRKARIKKSDESSSDEECTIELRDIRKSLGTLENLGTILEEGEENDSSLEPTKVKAKWDQKRPTLDASGRKSPKTLAPIQEEEDSDTSDLELMTESDSRDSQQTGSSLHDVTEESSDTTVDSQQTSRKSIARNRFYFPPPKSLLPPAITSTSIDAGMEIKDTYIDMKSVKNGRKKMTELYSIPVVSTDDSYLKGSVITPDFEAKHSVPAEKSLRQQQKDKKAARLATTGKEWFNLKPPEMTEEVKRDLEILQMRGILDPKRFYKHNDRKTLPKYFQIGRVMDNPVDFYSSRVPKKQRKANLTEELLADAEFRQYQKRKYNEIQIKQKARGAKRRRIKHGKFSKRNKESGS